MYVIQKSKQIRTKTIQPRYTEYRFQLCMSFKKVNKYGLKQSTPYKTLKRNKLKPVLERKKAVPQSTAFVFDLPFFSFLK